MCVCAQKLVKDYAKDAFGMEFGDKDTWDKMLAQVGGKAWDEGVTHDFSFDDKKDKVTWGAAFPINKKESED